MTFRKPSWIQANSHPAEDMRLTVLSGMVMQQGIVNSGDLAVTANGSPNMSVNVAAGGGWIAGTQSAVQGFYSGYNDAAVNLSVAAADATNPRLDRVVVKVQDAAYSGSTNAVSAVVVTGTPNAGAAIGNTTGMAAAPANSFDLGKIIVAANATSITSGNIADLRPNAIMMGGNVIDTAAARARQAVIPEGVGWSETDTNIDYISDGAAYNQVVTYGAWQTYTPAWTSSGGNCTIGNGTIEGRFQKIGRAVQFQCSMVLGSTSAEHAGSQLISIPQAAAAFVYPVSAFVRISGVYTRLVAYIVGGATTVTMQIGDSTNHAFDDTHPAALASGDAFYVNGTYEAASA